MVVLDSCRGRCELADEPIVDQEALDKGPKMRVAHRQQNLAQPRQQLRDTLRTLRQKLVGLHLCTGDHIEVGQDDLQRTLKNLSLAPDVQVIAWLEQTG